MKIFKKLLVLLLVLTDFVFSVQPVLAAKNNSVKTSTVNKSKRDNSLKRIKRKGTLVVGLSADYPPYEFTRQENGKAKYVGFEIDLARRFAKDLGVKCVIKNMDFDSLLVALETGKIDVIISGMNVTPERAKSVSFSNTYYSGNSWFLINKSDRNKYRTPRDFKGRTIGAQNGTLQYNTIKSQMKYASVKGLAKLSSLIMGLQSHKVEAVLADEATAKAYAANNSNLYAFNSNLKISAGGIAMAFPKGTTSLRLAANRTIAQVKKQDLINKRWIPAAAKYMENYKRTNTVWSYWTYFASGLRYTLIISVTAVIFGFILGVIFALMRLSGNKLLHAIAVCYIEFLRGTPMMVQIMFVYFGIGAVVRSLPALLAGIIAVSLNSGAYVAEIIRSGIQSVPIGQTEASRSLGLSRHKAFRYVILPQALKNIWPALGNELITLVKDSSLVSVIGVGELMYQTQLVQAATYKGVLPLFITMLIYFFVTFILSRLLLYFEGRMNH